MLISEVGIHVFCFVLFSGFDFEVTLGTYIGGKIHHVFHVCVKSCAWKRNVPCFLEKGDNYLI